MPISNYYSDLTLRKITETEDATGGAVLSNTDTTFKGLVTIASSRELELGNKLQIETTHTLYCDTSVALDVKDKIVDGTAIYQIVDEPRNTVKRNHHYKVALRRVINDGTR